MKKYTLFSFAFILALILLGSFGVKSASAANCAAGDLFSSVTGKACEVKTTSTSCPAGDLFSTVTGQPCSGTTTTSDNSSDVTKFNSLFKSNFTIGLKGSNDVTALQQFLKDQGYYFGKVDGSYGRITARAVSDFKGDNDLGVTVTPPTPVQTCLPRPSCLDSNPRCMIAEPVGGWCHQNSSSAPVINGVSGPQTLNVNQQGTWTVNASDTNSGNLSYAVSWGDQPNAYALNSSTSYANQQSATFTHNYYQTGNYAPTFVVTNTTTGKTAQTSLSVNVGNVVVPTQTLTITTPSQLPSATVGQPYSATLNTSGIDPSNGYNWSVNNGAVAFPVPGLGSDSSYFTKNSFHIMGTPVDVYLAGVLQTTPYTFTFNVTVNSGSQTITKQFNLTVYPATVVVPTQTLSITTPSNLPNAKVGQPYLATLNTSGIDPNNGYNWSVDDKFPLIGFNFVSSTRNSNSITGTPGGAGTFTFNVTVSSGPQTATKQFTLLVAPATCPISGGFDSTTGFRCGCSSISGYSSYDGQSCSVY